MKVRELQESLENLQAQIRRMYVSACTLPLLPILNQPRLEQQLLEMEPLLIKLVKDVNEALHTHLQILPQGTKGGGEPPKSQA
jgi:hypothetical protein